MVKMTTKGIKIFKTCNLYLCFIVLGMSISLPGPTLLDLQSIVNTDTKNIAFIYTARSIGYILGSITGAIVFTVTKKNQLVMTIFNLLVSISMLLIPWSRRIEVLAAFMIINGCSLGVVDNGGNVCCLNIWGKESGPFFQALHFCFGIGGLIAPLIAAPFLGNTNQVLQIQYNDSLAFFNSSHQYNLESHFPDSSSNPSLGIPSVTYAYTIIGSFSLLVTGLFLITSIISPVDPSSQETEGDVKKNSLKFIITLVLLNMILMFMATGTEIGFSQMLTAYAVKGPLKLSKTVGSFMTSAFWAAFTLSRLAQVFVAIKVRSFTLILFDLITNSIGALILLLLGGSEEWALWLSTVVLGVGIASFFPAAIGWLKDYITVTSKITATVTVSAGIGEMVIPFAISLYIEEVPKSLLYVVMTTCVLSILAVFLMYLLVRKRDTKSTAKEGKQNETFDSNENL